MPTSTEPAEDFASAALRHILDARSLIDPPEGGTPSPDQCWHLAGFGPECARKAALTSSKLQKVLGHDLTDDALTGWLLALEAGAPDQARERAPVGRWSPNDRYQATGSFSNERARELLGTCEADTLRILARLWTLGTISGRGC